MSVQFSSLDSRLRAIKQKSDWGRPGTLEPHLNRHLADSIWLPTAECDIFLILAYLAQGSNALA